MYIEELKNGHFRYQIKFTEERTGKPKRVSVTLDKNTDKAKREAEKILNEKIRKINASFSGSQETLREAFDAYLNVKKGSWRPATYRRNRYAGKALCELLSSDTLISRLTARFVQERIFTQEMKTTTLNELLVRFKGFLRWCWMTDRIKDISWLDKLQPLPEPTSKQKNAEKYLERDELAKLLPEMKVDVNRYMISLLALSGLRVGEALCLLKSDVDLSNRVIHVTKTMDHPTGEVLNGAKTLSSIRDVYIQDELYGLCKEIRSYMNKMSVLYGFRTELFISDFDGQPLTYARLNKYFAENTEKIIGRRLTLHSLRHTHASLMFEGGASLESVSLRLGHSDSRTTKEIYLHFTERLKDKYNKQFDRIKILVPKSSP